MKNEFENKCKIIVSECISNLIDLRYSPNNLIQNNIIKFYFNQEMNTLSENAPTGIYTDNGYEERIELRLDLYKTKETIFIDAKHLTKKSNIAYTCFYDIKRARELNGSLWIVFFGNGYSKKVINNLKTIAPDNVKFIFGEYELQSELYKLNF